MYVSISLSALFIVNRQYTASNQKHQSCSFSYLQLETCRLGSAFPHPAYLREPRQVWQRSWSPSLQLPATPHPNHCHLREELAQLMRRQRTARFTAWLEQSKNGHIPWGSLGEKISYQNESLSSVYGVWPKNLSRCFYTWQEALLTNVAHLPSGEVTASMLQGELHWTTARWQQNNEKKKSMKAPTII